MELRVWRLRSHHLHHSNQDAEDGKMHGLQWHWYRITPLHLLLFPLSLLFRLIVAIRRSFSG